VLPGPTSIATVPARTTKDTKDKSTGGVFGLSALAELSKAAKAEGSRDHLRRRSTAFRIVRSGKGQPQTGHQGASATRKADPPRRK